MTTENDNSSAGKEMEDNYEVSNSLSLYEEARALMDAGQLDQAIATFHASALENPHFKTYELLGECYLKLSRFKEAIPYLAAATALNRQVRSPSLLAEAFLALGWHSDAVDMAKVALAIEPNNRKARHVLNIAQPILYELFPHIRELDQNDSSKA